jgi:hypothetical protein
MKNFFSKTPNVKQAIGKQRIGAGMRALCVALAMATSNGFAISLLPGREISPIGTTLSAHPELAGMAIANVNRPFSIPDGSGRVVSGYLQDRVVRSTETGTLIFSQRVVLDVTSSGTKSVAEWVRNAMTSVTTNVDYRTDGEGNMGASSVQRSNTGSNVRFKMPRLIARGQSTRFHEIVTNATNYAATGQTTLSGPGLPDTVLTTFQPTGTPQPYYTATSLGYSGDFYVYLNDYGQVSSTVGVNFSYIKPILWQPSVPNGTDGSAYAIPNLPGFLYSDAMKINNRGQIVGNSFNRPIWGGGGDRTMRGHVWTPSVANGISGATTSVGIYPGGSLSWVSDINDIGQMIGSGDYPGAPIGADGAPYATSLLWSAGGIHQIGRTGFGGGRAINRFGKIAGFGNFVAGTYQGMVWTPTIPNGTTGSVVSVNTVGGINYQGPGVANDINDSGVAVGSALFGWPDGPTQVQHGYIWSVSSVRDLGPSEMPYAINNAGVAVGAYPGKGTLYRNGVRTTLDYFVSPSNWQIKTAYDVNNREQITGIGFSPSLGYAQLLMTPVRINSLYPAVRVQGSGSFTLTINGMGFLAGSSVLWNGASLPATRVNSNQLRVEVPGIYVETPGPASVMVVNPDGTTSSVRNFTTS